MAVFDLPINERWVVILCGGRGSRLAPITNTIPKSLIKIHKKPILWYVFLTLFKYGFRRFIFPLGYKGEMIEEFVTREFKDRECKLMFFDTGVDTPIAQRLEKVKNTIPEHEDFFLINGDTLFDFDIHSMHKFHHERSALLTLSSTDYISTYGVILEENNQVTDFVYGSKISRIFMDKDCAVEGYRNAGFTWLNKDAFQLIDLVECSNFEETLIHEVVKTGRAYHYRIDGDWFPVETQKDIDMINGVGKTKYQLGKFLVESRKNLL